MHEKPRQRRPAFDREQGIAIAQALFHQRGFDAVSLANVELDMFLIKIDNSIRCDINHV